MIRMSFHRPCQIMAAATVLVSSALLADTAQAASQTTFNMVRSNGLPAACAARASARVQIQSLGFAERMTVTVSGLPSGTGLDLFTIQVGLASPSLVGIVPSVEMVIYAAVGGRLSLVGAVYGAVLVGSAKTFFSENFVEYWMYFIGLLFVIIVMFLPDGLAGLLDRIRGKHKQAAPALHGDIAATPATGAALADQTGSGK